MRQTRFLVLSLLGLMLTSFTTTGSSTSRPESASETGQSLVGAWEVTASRPQGVGKNLLTFSSDGTFFRSGDTHPVLSGGHGAWKLRSKREVDRKYQDPDTDYAEPRWKRVHRRSEGQRAGPGGQGRKDLGITPSGQTHPSRVVLTWRSNRVTTDTVG